MTLTDFYYLVLCFSVLLLLFAFYRNIIVVEQNRKMRDKKPLFDERDCFDDSVDLITWNKELRALRD
jgi:hypothetical protein